MKQFRVHNLRDRAYLVALAFGDFHVSKHGRKVRVEASSTHPAQIDLVADLFDEYGKQIKYPIRNGQAAAWRIVYDLDWTFSFLLEAKDRVTRGLSSSRHFYHILSGLVDSEGHVGLVRRGNSAYPVLTVSNCNRRIMRLLLCRLRFLGYPANLQSREYSPGRSIYQLSVRGSKALGLLCKLSLRHREKVVARSIVLLATHSPKRLLAVYCRFRHQLKLDRDASVQDAIEQYRQRESKKARRMLAFERVAADAMMMKGAGLTIKEIAKSLNRSERTAYRLLGRKARHGTPKKTEQAHQREKPLSDQARL